MRVLIAALLGLLIGANAWACDDYEQWVDYCRTHTVFECCKRAGTFAHCVNGHPDKWLAERAWSKDYKGYPLLVRGPNSDSPQCNDVQLDCVNCGCGHTEWVDEIRAQQNDVK